MFKLEPLENSPVTAASVIMRVEVDLLGGGAYRGKLLSKYLEEPYRFFSVVRMIEKMEEIFDSKNFPQAYFTLRSFGDDEKNKREKTGEKNSDIGGGTYNTPLYEKQAIGKCTFDILVKFRQHVTWQGYIHWIEKDLKQDFLSELEMLRLMDEALNETEGMPERIGWVTAESNIAT